MSAMSSAGVPGRVARRVVAVPLPSLRVLPTPARTAGTTSFVLAVVLALAVGLAGVLALTLALQQRAFELAAIRQDVLGLAEQRAILQADLADREGPARLTRQARNLGMVPEGPPVFLDLQTGRLTGAPTPAAPPARTPR
jgi:hypothetical protein